MAFKYPTQLFTLDAFDFRQHHVRDLSLVIEAV